MAKIEIRNISKSYRKKQALADFCADFESGVYGLVGPNGAGKTTLMKILSGLMKPDRGKISLSGKDMKKMGREYYRHISYMPQDFGFYPFYTAMETMKYYRILKDIDCDEKQLKEILEKVNLGEVYDNKVKTFSGGMKRRLGIAVTMIGCPDFMIFDEPTAGLDPEERIRYKELIREKGKTSTVIISTHILSDVDSVCDKVVFMDRGKLIKITDKISHNDKLTDELEDKYMEMIGAAAGRQEENI